MNLQRLPRGLTYLPLLLFSLVLTNSPLTQGDGMVEPLDLAGEPILLEFGIQAVGPTRLSR